MTLRILHVIDSLERNGVAGQLCLLAANLPRNAFSNSVVSLDRAAPYAETLARAGVPITSLGRRWPFDPFALVRLCDLITRLRPDFVHAWTPAARVCSELAARWCGVRKLVVAWRSIEDDASVWFHRLVAERACAVVVNSAAMRHECHVMGLADEICLIPNGVAVPLPTVVSRRQLLDRLKLGNSVRLIAAAGPLLRNRGVKDAIWAADLLKVIRDDVHLLIFGDGPHRERLELFRDQVKIADKVHFMGDSADLPDWLPHVDLFWSARRTTGTPNAVLEAMAAARPIVACDAPGMRELVANGRTGYLVRPGHRAGLTQWADHLLNHPDLSRQLGEAGRARAIGEFGFERMVANYAALYESA